MNQFKKAKQKLIEQGKEIENITDLKTAGVAEPDQSEEDVKKQINAPKEENTKNELPNVKKVEKNTDEKSVEKIQEKPEMTPIDTVVKKDILYEMSYEKTMEEPESLSISEDPIELINNSSLDTPIETEIPSLEKESHVSIEKKLNYDNNRESVIDVNGNPHIESTIQYAEAVPLPKQVIIEPRQQQSIQQVQPDLRHPVYINQSNEYTQQYTRVPQQYQDSIQQPYINAQYINQQATHTTKKSMPNIFSPKEEAKSMRKSLVLKPTSVKKAENYCNKNGGSFNELIQTLLDNFIDEYGL